MNNRQFDLFTTSADYVSWDKYYQQLEFIDLPELSRNQARWSISYLRELLGENFLFEARETGNELLSLFLNAAPCARLSLIRFAEALKSLDKANKFDGVVDRIKDARRIGECLTVLDTAYKFRSSGFNVDFDPDVLVANKDGVSVPKIPDLKLIDENSGEVIFVEVSRLKPSAKQDLNSRTFHVIWNVIHDGMNLDPDAWRDISNPKHILPYARIERALEEHELVDVVEALKTLIEDVRVNKVHRELSFVNKIEVAISPSHDHSRALEWAAARNMTELVEGPVIPFNEINRTKGKIFDELHQLPDDRPGIIVIPTIGNLMLFVYDVRELILELANEVSRHPKLFCVVVTHTFISSDTEDLIVAALGQHTVIRRRTNDQLTEQSVVILNDSYDVGVSPSASMKIHSAFLNG